MNISGPSVKQAYDQKLHNPQTFRPPNRRLVIIHDSIHQSPFKISPRFGGSANGHNGVRSVIAALGTTDFYRMRIGIGSPTQSRGILEQYVLDKLPPDELEYWSPGGEGIERVWESIVRMIEDEYVISFYKL
jgi:PTH1 family peptidyl-tRNA hydrolase